MRRPLEIIVEYACIVLNKCIFSKYCFFFVCNIMKKIKANALRWGLGYLTYAFLPFVHTPLICTQQNNMYIYTYYIIR